MTELGDGLPETGYLELVQMAAVPPCERVVDRLGKDVEGVPWRHREDPARGGPQRAGIPTAEQLDPYRPPRRASTSHAVIVPRSEPGGGRTRRSLADTRPGRRGPAGRGRPGDAPPGAHGTGIDRMKLAAPADGPKCWHTCHELTYARPRDRHLPPWMSVSKYVAATSSISLDEHQRSTATSQIQHSPRPLTSQSPCHDAGCS